MYSFGDCVETRMGCEAFVGLALAVAEPSTFRVQNDLHSKRLRKSQESDGSTRFAVLGLGPSIGREPI